MRSTAVELRVNGLLAIALAAASAALFFGTDLLKHEIMYAALFLTAVAWLMSVKILGWLALYSLWTRREIRWLEIRVADTRPHPDR